MIGRCLICGYPPSAEVHGTGGHVFVPGGARPDPQPRVTGAGLEHSPPPGTLVLYTLGHGPSAGQERPALVLRAIERLTHEHGAELLGRLPEPLRTAARRALAGWKAENNLVRVRVFCDDVVDGLADHTCTAAYAPEPVLWHYSPPDRRAIRW